MRLTPEWRARHLRRDQCRLTADARKRAGLSRADLAGRLGVAEDVVAQIESGSLLLDPGSRAHVVEACGFAIEWVQGVVRDRLRLKPLDEWDRERLDTVQEVRARHDGDGAIDLPTLTFLAQCLRRTRPADAASLLERAIELGGTTPGADLARLHMDLAEVLQMVGDLERATQHAEAALAIAGADRTRYLHRYALILRDAGDLTAARAAAREFIETQDRDPQQPAWRNLELDILLGNLASSGPEPTG